MTFFANPDPEINQWDWSFVSLNQSTGDGFKPDGVDLTVGEGYVLLTVQDVTPVMFGSYKVTSVNEYGQDETTLDLVPEGNIYTMA